MRTLLDLGAVRPDLVASSLDALMVAGTITAAGVRRVLEEERRRGRPGVRVLERALDDLPDLGKPPDSVLELTMGRLLERAGLGEWSFHHRVGRYELDFAIPALCFGVEVDGLEA